MSVKYLLLYLGVFTVTWFTICDTCHVNTAWAEVHSLERDLPMELPPETLKSTAEEPTGVITLKEALSLALLKNPELKAFSLEVRSLEARALQAGLLPNPELGVESENFGGSGELRGLEGTETTIQLSQLIELAGKRSKRKQIAAFEQDLSGWNYKSKRADVLTGVIKAFVDVLAAQERLSLTEELARLATQVFNTVSERVKAGKVSPVEETRAKVAHTTSQIKFERAKHELEAARKRLSVMWGSTSPLFEKAEGRLDVIVSVPSAEQLENLISKNPDIARWDVEMKQRRASMKLEEAKRIPDVTLSAGLRHLNETKDNAFVMGLSIPIPLFNRNQGGILESKYRLSMAEEECRVAKLRVLAALSEAYQALSIAFAESTALKRDVLPAAQTTFDAAREGYRQGKFDYIFVLDAQRTLFEARGQYIEALASYHKAVSEVERLIGTRLDAL